MTALEAALQYAGRGWPVLPCRDKVPLVRGGVHAATRDLATIERWWHTWPQANVAVTCGAPSEGIRNRVFDWGELRSDGLYVVAPPARGREWISHSVIADLPEHLVKIGSNPHPPIPPQPLGTSGRYSA